MVGDKSRERERERETKLVIDIGKLLVVWKKKRRVNTRKVKIR